MDGASLIIGLFLFFIIIGLPVGLIVFLIWIAVRSPKTKAGPTKHKSFAERKGEMGEILVSRSLATLGSSYSVINDIVLPKKNGESTQVDHLVISRYGIFVIETKNYENCWILGHENANQWTRQQFHRADKFMNPIIQNKAHVGAIKHLLGKQKHIHSIIAFANSAEFQFNNEFINADVVHMKNVVPTIQAFKEEVFTVEQVKQMHIQIIGAGKRGIEATKQHVASLHERHKEKERKITQGLCPICAGKLVEREGAHGKFLGCGNYPRCRFKTEYRNIEELKIEYKNTPEIIKTKVFKFESIEDLMEFAKYLSAELTNQDFRIHASEVLEFTSNHYSTSTEYLENFHEVLLEVLSNVKHRLSNHWIVYIQRAIAATQSPLKS